MVPETQMAQIPTDDADGFASPEEGNGRIGRVQLAPTALGDSTQQNRLPTVAAE
jgi:hypothetical protein